MLNFSRITLLIVFLFSSFLSSLKSQTRLPSERPKLIVAIVVEDMRSEYLYRFKEKFEKDGFNKLMNEGAYCKNASYDYLITQSAPGIASITTGCSPSVHGIVSNYWYNRNNEEFTECCFDKKQKAVGSNALSGNYSPTKI